MPLFGPPNIEKLKRKRDVSGLIKALRDGNVRIDAALALMEIKDARAVMPLVAGLQDRDMFVSVTAARILGEIKDARAVEPLVAALEDRRSEVRYEAADALGEIEDARASEPLALILGTDVDGLMRQRATVALGKIKDAHTVWVLVEALQDKDRFVRGEAERALSRIGVSVHDLWETLAVRAVEPLLAALQDGNWSVRMAAALALSKIKDTRAVEPLLATWEDENEYVRAAASHAVALHIAWGHIRFDAGGQRQ